MTTAAQAGMTPFLCQGLFTAADGSIYIGTWKKGHKREGVETYPDNGEYKGQFCELSRKNHWTLDKWHGKGEYHYPDGRM